jgi:hypothetical protein
MVMILKQKGALMAAGLALLVALTGCSAAGKAAAPKVAEAAAAAFTETDEVDGIKVTLLVDPLVPNQENRFLVDLSDKAITAMEIQVVMLDMGHGQMADMVQIAPGQFELKTPVIDMPGRWMARLQMTTAAGAEKTVPFYLRVK